MRLSQIIYWLYFHRSVPYINDIFIGTDCVLVIFSGAWTLCAISPRCAITQASNQTWRNKRQRRALNLLVAAMDCYHNCCWLISNFFPNLLLAVHSWRFLKCTVRMFHDFHIVFPALYTISVFLLFLTKFFPLSICASKRVLICFNMNITFISHANYSLTIFRVSWNFFPAWQAVMFKIYVCIPSFPLCP